MNPLRTTHELLNDFPVVIALPVQWGDQDALGHVNNVTWFRWLESSRIAYCEAAGLLRHALDDRLGTVLASIQCDFQQQISYPDRVVIGARATRVGNSSIGIEHRLIGGKPEQIAGQATSTIVMFDFASQRPIRVPDEIRRAIAKQEADCGRSIEL